MITKLLTRDVRLILVASFFLYGLSDDGDAVDYWFFRKSWRQRGFDGLGWRDDEHCFSMLPAFRWQFGG